MHENKLQAAIANQNISPFLTRILEEFAKDAYGLEQTTAPSIIASLTNRSFDECNQAIIELVGRNLLLRVEDGSGVRLVANYQQLGIDEETRRALFLRAWSFEILGAPHSPKAMSTLDALFREERQPIYVGLEVTSHKVFREIEARANEGRRTIFLMPKKSDLPSERQLHHDEVMATWINFLRKGPEVLRKHVRICLTPKALPHLYTSAIGPNHVRLDLYQYDQNTTRRGEMVLTRRGSSLYDLAYRQYCEAVYMSPPLASVWPWEWVRFTLRRYWLTATGVGLAALLTWIGGGFATLFAALFLGVAANALYEGLRSRTWVPPDLYARP